MKQGIIMRSPTENSPTTCIQASASEPEADAAPEVPADVDQIGDVSLPERLWRAVPASAGLPACAVGRARQTNCADCDALPRCVGRRATIRVEIAEIRNSPCQIAVLWPENGDLTRGIIKNGYFNPCFGEVRRRDGGARKKRKPGGEAGLEREEKKGFSYCGLAVVITI